MAAIYTAHPERLRRVARHCRRRLKAAVQSACKRWRRNESTNFALSEISKGDRRVVLQMRTNNLYAKWQPVATQADGH